MLLGVLLCLASSESSVVGTPLLESLLVFQLLCYGESSAVGAPSVDLNETISVRSKQHGKHLNSYNNHISVDCWVNGSKLLHIQYSKILR